MSHIGVPVEGAQMERKKIVMCLHRLSNSLLRGNQVTLPMLFVLVHTLKGSHSLP